ncbi:MAG: hypothetical protein ABSG31_05010 [Tepidisphaeraceae bacterium]|jgi:hypothetical protein
MLRQTIETHLTKLLGRPARIGDLNVSPLTGSFDAANVRIGDEKFSVEIDQINGKISMAKALAKHISIKSMNIAGLRVQIKSLPKISKKKPDAPASPSAPAKSAWRADARAIVLKDAAVEFPDYNFSIEKITGEFRQDLDESESTFESTAEIHAKQITQPIPVQITGQFDNLTDLLLIAASPMQLQFRIANQPAINITHMGLAFGKLRLEIKGPVSADLLSQFFSLPPGVAVDGGVDISAGVDLQLPF